MHKLIFLFLFLPSFCFGQDLSQPYGGEKAKWIYNFTGMYDGVTVVQSSHDTLVENRLLTIFEKATFFEDEYGEMGVWNRAPVYIHSDEGVVAFSTDLVHFDTLYNFRLGIGDSWTIIERDLVPGQLTGDTISGTIVDTFTILRNDGKVFCQEVLWNERTRVDTVYQDFGSRYSYILPFENSKAYGEGNVLLCFENERLGPIDFEEYHLVNCPSCVFTTFEYDCGVVIGTSPARSSDFSLYPNPVSNILHIKGKVENINQIEIYNLHGQLVLHKQSDGAFIEVDVAGISSGLYYVILNRKYFEKIAIHRN